MKKVFFIGFAKTGTISLFAAMGSIFGFKCFHGGGRDLHRTKDETIVEELKRRGYSEMLKDCDVYIDWEYLSNKFEVVYKHFPDAKYIFNTRNVDDWIESLKRHHSMLSQDSIEKSGWYFVDEEERREYYDNHTKKVLDFFKDKQGQFLVLNICSGDGYEKLCPFLGLDIPEKSFPYLHKRGKSK
jgi:hypothetical protein|tara:strand:+ start:349 stop:903 length:555 start_codon:yes stop_codon:yes gene_type:complete